MTQANQADLFGEGVNPGVRRPYDPNDEPNPNNPGGVSNNEMLRLQNQYRANPSNRQGNPTAGLGGSDGQIAAARAALAKNASVRPKGRNAGEFLGDLWNVPAKVATAPVNATAGKIPGIQNTVRGVTNAFVEAPTEAIKEGVNNPGRTLATGGFNTVIAASDSAADNIATGVYRDITGRKGAVDLPLTPKQIAGAASSAGKAIGGGFNAAFGGGSGGSGVGGGAPIGGTPQFQQTGGSALSAEAERILGSAAQMAQASQNQANTFYGQAAQAGTRAAPQITAPSSGQMDAVYDRAMNFNAQSGAAAIRAERADISGAGRLEGMQLDQQGINNLEGFRSENTAAGVDALNAFNPRRTFASADQLGSFSAVNTAKGAEALQFYNPTANDQDASALRNFQYDREGIDRLRSYATEAEGPSAAQALLRSQADADKRTQIAIARSGRGVAGSVQAQRQAISEGGLIEAETRGQGAALRAQETEAYKGRQLQALAQMGQQISAGEAMRLQGMQAAGQLMTQQDQLKLSALQAYAQQKGLQDSQELSARQSAGQLNATGEGMKLNATSNAANLQNSMDQQRLSAIGQAAGLRTQGDQIRSNNLQAAGNIRLQGSEINQRGAIAASSADLQAQALNLQSLSLAGNISTTIRSQNIDVLKSNLSSELQTLGLNDQQVRFFSQMASDREVASQNLTMQANNMGANLEQAQQALDLQWAQFGFSQLTTQQQAAFQQQQFNAQQTQANRNFGLNAAGTALTGLSMLLGRGGGGGAASSGPGYVAPLNLPQVPNFQLTPMSYQNVGSGGGANAAGAPAGLGSLPAGSAGQNFQLTMPQYQTPYSQLPGVTSYNQPPAQYSQPAETTY